MTWEPQQYVLGNYFQTQVNELFCKSFSREPAGDILDVGCGDGYYSNRLATIYKKSRILGIDSSPEMIKHANQLWARANLSFEVHRIEDFHQQSAFDFVLSFWCLHWTSIDESLLNIFQALKKEGILYAVFSSFSDNSIFQIWQELARQGRHTQLAEEYVETLDSYTNYFYYVLNILARIPFKHMKLDLKTVRIFLPTIDYLQHLILTLPFIQQIPEGVRDELIMDMLGAFMQICQRKYAGKLYYETRPIFLHAVK